MLQDRTNAIAATNALKWIQKYLQFDFYWSKKKISGKNLKLIGNLNYLFHSHKKASKKLFSVNFW